MYKFIFSIILLGFTAVVSPIKGANIEAGIMHPSLGGVVPYQKRVSAGAGTVSSEGSTETLTDGRSIRSDSSSSTGDIGTDKDATTSILSAGAGGAGSSGPLPRDEDLIFAHLIVDEQGLATNLTKEETDFLKSVTWGEFRNIGRYSKLNDDQREEMINGIIRMEPSIFSKAGKVYYEAGNDTARFAAALWHTYKSLLAEEPDKAKKAILIGMFYQNNRIYSENSVLQQLVQKGHDKGWHTHWYTIAKACPSTFNQAAIYLGEIEDDAAEQ